MGPDQAQESYIIFKASSVREYACGHQLSNMCDRTVTRTVVASSLMSSRRVMISD